MNEITRTAPEKPHPSAPAAAREGLGGPALLLAICVAGIVAGIGAARPPVPAAPPPAAPIERAAAAPEADYTPAAQSITPISSLTADTTGALYVSADRIDLWARTSSSTATLSLVEYSADDAKWAKVGADCSVTTDLTLCRYVAKRGARYWHVYKASGSMAYVGLEALTLPVGASLGSIEPGSSISLPIGPASGGTGLTSFTAGDLLYATGATTLARRAVGSEGYVLTVVSGTPAWAAASSPAGAAGIYCDGSDGSATITGGTTTLAADKCWTTATVSGTGVLKTAGYRVYCSTSLTVQSGGVMHNDGNAASGATQGGVPSSAILGGGGAGGAGQTGAGTGPSNVTVAFGGAGGNGGSGTGGAGGAGATPTAPGASNGHARPLMMAASGSFMSGTSINQWKGGAGGGGGGGNGSANGGGGGGGGGVMTIVCKAISNSGAIRALGGNGANGTASNAGGGGGGGGTINYVTAAYTGTAPDVSGGARGLSGGGSGNNGVDGSPGTVWALVN